ncbi:MAG: translation initiation factor [Clostridiales bacterium]|jgi:translation initiation factor IF-3|uniref:Translation initiation factor IF-3 n=1 Tax=Caldicoprobacter faecalis TaxID=937334 RepID=A0A1I5S8W6_9FIRM|nr:MULTISPECIES: translation initiation factor IF-3 [Caldicoprobacter]MCM8899624.1 translation initiation factor IF-3 [Caldicoprobacter algeriensis]MDN5276888.1 translation initiation factor [Clostridiales bacterium]PZN12066.1 MAG: translation initiation factor IF-3 [Caldicoprobacter oshimai]SFP67153.1 bacterial translation initiation factor 3 (bIF-3) [Caldicoprobacter faecalis]
MNINKKELLVNEQIKDREVRVISETGEQLGIMPIEKALRLAEERQLDLVKIAPKANPPVCKIMDYGKYLFEMAKKEKEARKNQKVINVKEIRLSASIEDHDLGVKARNADKFLKAGDKVKVTIRFRGREMAHPEVGYEVMEKFVSMLTVEAVMERKPTLEGNHMIMVLAPKA